MLSFIVFFIVIVVFIKIMDSSKNGWEKVSKKQDHYNNYDDIKAETETSKQRDEKNQKINHPAWEPNGYNKKTKVHYPAFIFDSEGWSTTKVYLPSTNTDEYIHVSTGDRFNPLGITKNGYKQTIVKPQVANTKITKIDIDNGWSENKLHKKTGVFFPDFEFDAQGWSTKKLYLPKANLYEYIHKNTGDQYNQYDYKKDGTKKFVPQHEKSASSAHKETIANKLTAHDNDISLEAYLSTTRVGEQLDIPQKEIIQVFIDAGLLERKEKKLELTDLGHNYGGKLRITDKGTWIIWPPNIIKNPLIQSISANHLKGVHPMNANFINQIFYKGIYHPYHHGSNPFFDEFSKTILDFKKDNPSAINYYFKLLQNVDFDNTQAITIVPSHDPSKKLSPVKKLAILLATHFHWIDATDCVIRTHMIDKLASGGNRSLEVHLKSLRIVNTALIENKNVLVLDDVTTSGHSLEATMQLLREKNIKSVWSFALAQTQN